MKTGKSRFRGREKLPSLSAVQTPGRKRQDKDQPSPRSTVALSVGNDVELGCSREKETRLTLGEIYVVLDLLHVS